MINANQLNKKKCTTSGQVEKIVRAFMFFLWLGKKEYRKESQKVVTSIKYTNNT